MFIRVCICSLCLYPTKHTCYVMRKCDKKLRPLMYVFDYVSRRCTFLTIKVSDYKSDEIIVLVFYPRKAYLQLTITQVSRDCISITYVDLVITHL